MTKKENMKAKRKLLSDAKIPAIMPYWFSEAIKRRYASVIEDMELFLIKEANKSYKNFKIEKKNYKIKIRLNPEIILIRKDLLKKKD